MPRRQIILLTGVMAVVALALGWLLLSIGRAGDETGQGPAVHSDVIDAGLLLHLTQTLADDSLQGRGMGTPGGEAARGFLHKRFEESGLKPVVGNSYEQSFSAIPPADAPSGFPTEGANLLGLVEGATPGEGRMIVVTAHYDHLGVKDGEIYNGADDNASGAVALTAVADYFAHHPPEHDLLFALVDGEEIGFLGSRYLVRSGALDLSRVALNINFDMVSRSHVDELYVAGAGHSPGLVPLVAEIEANARVTLLTGHDSPDLGHDDWTLQSDHAAFHEAGIPFLYFGVEDHPDYHKPTDDFDKIPQDFFVRSVETLVLAVKEADAELDSLDMTPAAAPAAQP
ncbi:MAG: M28 family peptidase [Hyphomonas sp.]|uniref:M28 family peptidase n=1 Tax=Hyphomonas sp. TaxID=87 RepID=UPI0035294395